MHIIVVSDRLATAHSITITMRHVAIAAAGFTVLVLAMAASVSVFALRHLPEIRLPYVQDILLSMRGEEALRTETFVRENLNSLATKLGEMQARVLHLGALGERLAEMAGLHPAEPGMPDNPGQGGQLLAPRALSAAEIETQLNSLSRQLDAKSDELDLIDTEFLDERIRRHTVPTSLPVRGAWDSSSFGRRIDPITGAVAMHTGVDFTVDKGTPVYAAAGGVVVYAQFHHQYGNMIEIDHGNDLTTRYAHASKLSVAEGQVVMPGQRIAEVGSTGRSTGPHLHFEVRVADVPKNPNRFLEMARDASHLAGR